jgi:prevent-host-death family protein
MKRATVENVQARLADYIRTSAKQPVLIVRNGEPVAMLVGLKPSRKPTPDKLRGDKPLNGRK